MALRIRIENLLNLLKTTTKCFCSISPITRRMLITGLLSEMQQITSELAIINNDLDSRISLEDADLDMSVLSVEGIDIHSIVDERRYINNDSTDSVINHMIDIFPLDNKDYTFTSDKADTFKTGMRHLCSDAIISPRDYTFAINKGINQIFSLLTTIQQKKSKIQDYQYEEYWYEYLGKDDDLIPELVTNDYDAWKEEHDWEDMQVLKDKRTQEILKLLKSGVFTHDVKPVKRDINNCIITIPEESLEDETELPENINTECARMSKYVYMKEDIMCLDYAKLGKYLYRHYRDVSYDEGDSLIYFDYMLDNIHNDMAACNPKLKVHLKFYEDDIFKATLDDAIRIMESCNCLLSDKVDKDFLKDYIAAALYSEVKTEVHAKLKSQSKITLICGMLGMMKTTLKVFKQGTTSAELAHELSTVVKKPLEDSLKRYIDKGASDNSSSISKWTTQYVMTQLSSESERLFAEIAQR